MNNYFNKNILFLSKSVEEEVARLSKMLLVNLSHKEKNSIIKSKIVSIIYHLTGQHIYDFICEVDNYNSDNFFLIIYDMDKKTCDVFYNYDFEYLQKVKDRKQKIEEILYE